MPDWSTFRASLFRRLAEMSALLKPSAKGPRPAEDWAKLADRRSAPTVDRLRAGIFLRYQQATGAHEDDAFERDAKTWAVFEHSVLPELANFTFVDKTRDVFVSAAAVLADGMFHIWTVANFETGTPGSVTTTEVIGELASYLCNAYETSRVDRRKRRRKWFPL